MLEIIEKAMKDPKVQKLIKENFFLGSVFGSIQDKELDKGLVNEWILHFFNPKTQQVIDCFVNDSVIIGKETPAIKEMKKFDTKRLKTTFDQAFETVKNDFKNKPTNVLISLHTNKSNVLVWTINMITPDLMATSYDIDAETGALLEKKRVCLMRRM